MGEINYNKPGLDLTGSGSYAAQMINDLTPVNWANTNQNNVALPTSPNPSGYEISLTGNMELTGVVAPSPGTDRSIMLLNISTNQVKIKHDDANSTAANRIVCPNRGDYDLNKGNFAEIAYHHGTSRWYVARSKE